MASSTAASISPNASRKTSTRRARSVSSPSETALAKVRRRDATAATSGCVASDDGSSAPPSVGSERRYPIAAWRLIRTPSSSSSVLGVASGVGGGGVVVVEVRETRSRRAEALARVEARGRFEHVGVFSRRRRRRARGGSFEDRRLALLALEALGERGVRAFPRRAREDASAAAIHFRRRRPSIVSGASDGARAHAREGLDVALALARGGERAERARDRPRRAQGLPPDEARGEARAEQDAAAIIVLVIVGRRGRRASRRGAARRALHRGRIGVAVGGRIRGRVVRLVLRVERARVLGLTGRERRERRRGGRTIVIAGRGERVSGRVASRGLLGVRPAPPLVVRAANRRELRGVRRGRVHAARGGAGREGARGDGRARRWGAEMGRVVVREEAL